MNGESLPRSLIQFVWAVGVHTGVGFFRGQIVQLNENVQPDVVFSNISPEAGNLSYIFQNMADRGFMVAMPGCAGLAYTADKGFAVKPLLATRDTAS